jgi:tRNA A37 threonylcarbamoyladenosine dehydratase
VSTSQAELTVSPQPASEVDENYKLHRRFDRIGRLVGDHGMARLFSSRVAVIGLGGVGSFAAESLIRSGIGAIDLVDFDLHHQQQSPTAGDERDCRQT